MLNSYRFAEAAPTFYLQSLGSASSDNPADLCGGPPPGFVSAWSNTAIPPEIGDIYYTTSAGTTPFNGLGEWWLNDNWFVSVLIDGNGVIQGIYEC